MAKPKNDEDQKIYEELLGVMLEAQLIMQETGAGLKAKGQQVQE